MYTRAMMSAQTLSGTAPEVSRFMCLLWLSREEEELYVIEYIHLFKVDFTPLLKEEFRVSGQRMERDVFNRQAWPTKEMMGLDKSQFNAVFQV